VRNIDGFERSIGLANSERSWKPDWKVKVENDNDNQTLIKEQWIHNLSEVVIEVDIVEKIKIARKKDKKVIRVIEEMKKIRVKVF